MLTDGSDLCFAPAEAGRVPGRSVLSGAFALLEALADADGDLSLTEAARRAGLPKSTAHRLLEQLCRMGAAEHGLPGYGIGPMFARLCEGRGRAHDRIRVAAGKPAVRLAKLSRADVVVGVPSGAEVLVVATFAGHSARRPVMAPGTVLRSPTPLAQALSGGADVAPGEVLAGLCCAAAPIPGPDGRVVAALGVLGPSAVELSRLRRPVLTAAAEAGRALSALRN